MPTQLHGRSRSSQVFLSGGWESLGKGRSTGRILLWRGGTAGFLNIRIRRRKDREVERRAEHRGRARIVSSGRRGGLAGQPGVLSPVSWDWERALWEEARAAVTTQVSTYLGALCGHQLDMLGFFTNPTNSLEGRR